MTAAELEVSLSSAQVEVRRAALVEAGTLKERALAWQVLGALGDRDWRVREEAVRVVAETAVEFELLHGLVDCLAQGANVGLRNAAREVLRTLGKAAVPTLIAALSEVEPGARKFVVEALACSAANEAVDELVQAVRGNDAMLSVTAMDALAHLGGEQAVLALRAKLCQGDVFVRTAALDALLRLDAHFDWSELATLLEDRLLRRVALDALGRSDDLRALPFLVSALSEKSSHTVARALLGLMRLQAHGDDQRQAVHVAMAQVPAHVLIRVRSFVAHEDPNVALAACVMLAHAARPEAAAAAVELLARGGSLAIVSDAIAGLGDAGVEAVLRLAEPEHAERAFAIELLSELGTELTLSEAQLERTRALLRGATHEHDVELLQTVLRAFARYAQAQDASGLALHAQADDTESAALACEALTRLAEREPDAVREVLANASLLGPAAPALAELMAALQVPDVIGRLRAALLSDSPAQRVAALAGLGKLDGAAAAELARLALRDESVEVQVSALAALAGMKHAGSQPIDALLQFESDDPEAQSALAYALVRLPDARALPRLRQLLRTGLPGARLFALRGLTCLRDPALDELLVEALGDVDSEVVKQALASLGEGHGERAVARIMIALDHPAWDVRRLAADWLRRLHASSAVGALRERLAREPDEYVRAAISDAVASVQRAREVG